MWVGLQSRRLGKRLIFQPLPKGRSVKEFWVAGKRHFRRKLRGVALGAVLAGLPLLVGCWPFPVPPEPTDLAARLEAFPTRQLGFEAPIEIRWNDHQVPYIFAQNDHDAAYALGLVHAHLRLGQMAIMRQIAEARLAEVIGPEGVKVDRGLLMLDLKKVARQSVREMSPASKAWAEAFVAGINAYQSSAKELPYEFEALGLRQERWTVEDIFELVHLSGVDITWLRWSALLPLRETDHWPEIWAEAQKGRSTSPVSFPVDRAALAKPVTGPAVGERGAGFLGLLKMVSKAGSNSYALGPDKTASKGAIIASDPHIGLMLPNFYLLVGVKTPDFEAVGLMAPGQPIFSVGRNAHVGWGQTNLIGAASDLIDVSDLPAEEIDTDIYRVKVRFLPAQEVSVRRTAYGPIISDLDVIDAGDAQIALKWMGQEPSDEIGAGLKVLKSKDWASFQDAFEAHALPSQNVTFADDQGNVGALVAAHLPKRAPKDAYAFLRKPEVVLEEWQEKVTSAALPRVFNPKEGFVASANNRPTKDAHQLISYFYGAPDRIFRLQSVLDAAREVTVEDVKLLQQDTFMLSSLEFRDRLVSAIDQANVKTASPALALIRQWDGHYDAGSGGALAFEAFFGPFASSLYSLEGRQAEFDALQDSGDLKWGAMAVLEAAPPEVLRDLVSAALVHADEAVETYKTWGGMHRLRLAHPFALVPDVDQAFFKIDLPAGGSAETLMKTSHSPTTKKHGSLFGSQSRHVSDMSTLDENYFVLLGGQDGWVNSSTFADQLDLWQSGDYIQMPLSDEKIAREFSHSVKFD
ncbi:MAG: penicillin acylase family protein [Alphaproteobacteria bacterium]|nr:MAG: penicillin acylase family protein [Alphaproteobacteria bacterium]